MCNGEEENQRKLNSSKTKNPFRLDVTSACHKMSYSVQTFQPIVDCVWNVMAHEQKPDFVFRRNERVHLNRRGESVQSITGSRGVRISGSNAGYTMFRGSVKSTGYPLHSPVSPTLPPPVRHSVPSHFNWTIFFVCLCHLGVGWKSLFHYFHIHISYSWYGTCLNRRCNECPFQDKSNTRI